MRTISRPWWIGTVFVFVLVLTWGGFTSGVFAYGGPTHKHKVWVKSTIKEEFYVAATESYDRETYWQNTTSVWDGRYDSGYCWHSSFPGWFQGACYGYITDGHYVYEEVDGVGRFQNGPFHVSYTMRTSAAAFNDNSFGYACWVVNGKVPRIWHGPYCKGGRYNG